MMSARQILGVAVVAMLLLSVTACADSSNTDTPAKENIEALSHNHYSGVVKINPSEGSISADWRIVLIEPQLETVTYLLNRNFDGVSVGGSAVGYDLQEYEIFGQNVWKIVVQLQPFAGEYRQIDISYHGVLLPEPMENRINTVSQDKVELTVDSLWHPFDDRFTQSVTVDIEVSIPGKWAGITTGASKQSENGVWLFKTAPGLDIPVTLIRDYRKTEATGYVIYDTRAHSDGMPELVESAGACTSYLNDHFGDVDPLPEAKIVVHDRESSGYSRKTMIALSEISGRDQSRLMQFVCHELAHYWSMRGAANTVENWLNETFADYVALMAVREELGDEVFEKFIARYREQLDKAGDLPPIWTPENQERGPYLVQYRKGPLALAALEERLGRDVFAQFVHRYMTDGIATTPALLDALEEVAGADARAQFEIDLAQ